MSGIVRVDCDSVSPEEAFEMISSATHAPPEYIHNVVALQQNLCEFLMECGYVFYSNFGWGGIRTVELANTETSCYVLNLQSPRQGEVLNLSKQFAELIDEWIVEMVNGGLPNRWEERRAMARFDELGLFIEEIHS